MKRHTTAALVTILLIGGLASFSCGPGEKTGEDGLDVKEITIARIHEALTRGELTCRELVEIYLARIEKYDKTTELNAIVVINPNARQRAEELDREFQETGTLRPLHGIPVIVSKIETIHII